MLITNCGRCARPECQPRTKNAREPTEALWGRCPLLRRKRQRREYRDQLQSEIATANIVVRFELVDRPGVDDLALVDDCGVARKS